MSPASHAAPHATTREADPLVSVIIPAYDPGPYLVEALGSALAQSYGGVEVIVVDDGSHEDFRAAVAAFGPAVKYVRQANRGVASARNRGVACSRGTFLAFLDADDRLLPTAIADGLAVLRERPDAALAAGLCQVIDMEGRPRPFTQQPDGSGDSYFDMLQSNFIWMPAQVVYRRQAFESAGGFDPQLDACADYDLYLRITRRYPIVRHRRVVADYRVHDRNMSGNAALMLVSALRALDRQWSFVRTRPIYRAAYWSGRRFWRQHYGTRLVEEIRADIKRPHARQRALRAAALLFRHHPLEVFRQLGRKARSVALDFGGNTR